MKRPPHDGVRRRRWINVASAVSTGHSPEILWQTRRAYEESHRLITCQHHPHSGRHYHWRYHHRLRNCRSEGVGGRLTATQRRARTQRRPSQRVGGGSRLPQSNASHSPSVPSLCSGGGRVPVSVLLGPTLSARTRRARVKAPKCDGRHILTTGDVKSSQLRRDGRPRAAPDTPRVVQIRRRKVNLAPLRRGFFSKPLSGILAGEK